MQKPVNTLASASVDSSGLFESILVFRSMAIGILYMSRSVTCISPGRLCVYVLDFKHSLGTAHEWDETNPLKMALPWRQQKVL